jgi:predicted phage baseplate assembly protein
MPLPAPILDDRTFDDIVTEAKARIPRYAPEWTDHNESDPGIALLQLFAWLTEITLYRLNQVPDLNYVKFLELIGTALRPAVPATVELTFDLAQPAPASVAVPRGTLVAAAGADGAPVLFETDTGLIAVGPPLAQIQSHDGSAYALLTREDADRRPYYPFGLHHRPGSALLLGFDVAAAELPTGPLDLAFAVEPQATGTVERSCDLGPGPPPPAVLAWEAWDPDRRAWSALQLERDRTRALTRSGHVVVRIAERLRPDALGLVTEPLVWIRCRLARERYELPPRLRMVLTNTVAATQALTVRDEVLGGSDGRPDQSFQLASVPVLDLRLEVDEGQGFEPWTRVDDFLASGPDARVYVLDPASGALRMGDGTNGRIPVANLANPGANVVAREYRTGGGRRGNVPAGAVTGLQTTVDGVDSVTNHAPAAGGADQETLEDAKRRAPRELRTRGRAVTADDFETLAVATPGAIVRRAKALPLAHPRFPGIEVPGCVTVIVVPESDAPNPLPNETTLAAVCAQLDRHRLLTTEVHVIGPTYRRVAIRVDVVARADADVGEVRRALDERLTRYLDPLRGGADGTGWPFGGDISYSGLYRQVIETAGVDGIRDGELHIVVDGEREPFCRDVPIGEGVLVYPGRHRITVDYGEDA